MASSKPEVARWTPDEVEREERARAERMRRDAERGVDDNLDDGVRLIEFAQTLAAAFRSDQPAR